MAETVNVPGIGKTNRVWVIGGLAAVAGIVAFAYMRQRTEPEPLGEGDYVPGDQWSPDAYAGAEVPPGGETYDPGAVVNLPPRDIAEWSQRVIDALGAMGFDITFAAQTIGKYVAGQALNAGEKLLVQSGIAVVGNTPGTPLPIISSPEPTAPTPAPAGKLATPTMRASAGSTANTNYALAWTAVPGAQRYLVKRERGPGINPLYRIVTGTGYRTHALQRRWVYQYRVQAQATGRPNSDWSNAVNFKVPAK
jgi:hypothetical protein